MARIRRIVQAGQSQGSVVYLSVLSRGCRRHLPAAVWHSVWGAESSRQSWPDGPRLFLIGTSLSKKTLQQVGVRPFVQGISLWVIVAGASLAAIYFNYNFHLRDLQFHSTPNHCPRFTIRPVARGANCSARSSTNRCDENERCQACRLGARHRGQRKTSAPDPDLAPWPASASPRQAGLRNRPAGYKGNA